MTKTKNKGPKKKQAYRLRLYKRDKGICYLCNLPVNILEFTLDHVIPHCKGGKSNRENLKITHEKCNTKKGKNSVEHIKLKLNL